MTDEMNVSPEEMLRDNQTLRAQLEVERTRRTRTYIIVFCIALFVGGAIGAGTSLLVSHGLAENNAYNTAINCSNIQRLSRIMRSAQEEQRKQSAALLPAFQRALKLTPGQLQAALQASRDIQERQLKALDDLANNSCEQLR